MLELYDLFVLAKSPGAQKHRCKRMNLSHGKHSRSARNWGQAGFMKKHDQASQHARRTQIRSTIKLYHRDLHELCTAELATLKK